MKICPLHFTTTLYKLYSYARVCKNVSYKILFILGNRETKSKKMVPSKYIIKGLHHEQ